MVLRISKHFSFVIFSVGRFLTELRAKFNAENVENHHFIDQNPPKNLQNKHLIWFRHA